VEEHLAVCARCRRELAELEALVEEARGLRAAVEPPRDLWPDIAARLAPRPARRPARALPWLPLAAAAVLLLVLVGALVLRGWSPGAAPPETETALGASPAPGRALSRQVLAALERQRGNLSPATVSSLEGSLAALDRSIGDLRAALASDPGNRRLHLWLAERYRQELELLQRLQLLEVPPRPRS
jgi:anti-sigma factor RsiW